MAVRCEPLTGSVSERLGSGNGCNKASIISVAMEECKALTFGSWPWIRIRRIVGTIGVHPPWQLSSLNLRFHPKFAGHCRSCACKSFYFLLRDINRCQ